MIRWPLFVFLLLVPHSSLAAVYLSEIAWMGTPNSANDEWIEIHNSGSTAVDMNDWRITDNASFDVVLEGAGSLAPGAFGVLERTDDTSAPGTAWYVYAGSLANTGATLRLYDASGALVDQVAGGENWENLGGDNATKETAQYTSGGWVTATPTPGASNRTAAGSAADTADSGDTTTASANPSPTTDTATSRSRAGQSREPTTPLGLTIVAPAVGYVAQPIEFTVDLRGRGSAAKAGRSVTWNFGDTGTESGRAVTHQYQYPGSYVVTARGQYQGDDVLVRHEITILPVALAITRNRDGAVQISNTAKYELALSDYTLTAAGESYTLPPDTFLKPNAAITLPPAVFAAATHEVVAVHDQAAQVVAYQVPGATRPAPPSTPPATRAIATRTTSPHASTQLAAPGFTFAGAAPLPRAEAATEPTPRIAATSTSRTLATAQPIANQTASVINAIPTAAADTPAEQGSEASTRPQNAIAYLALSGLLLLAIMALLVRQPKY